MLEWAVDKTTAEKLASILNDCSEAGRDIEQITYVGGRDWVVISYRQLKQEATR